jgi:hypothetical protein
MSEKRQMWVTRTIPTNARTSKESSSFQDFVIVARTQILKETNIHESPTNTPITAAKSLVIGSGLSFYGGDSPI